MLGYILGGLFAAAAVAIGVVIINGIITANRIKETMRNNNLKSAMISKINQCDNIITIEDMDSDEKLDIVGDGISDDIDEYDIIYVWC